MAERVPGPTDDQLLRMLHEVEEQEDAVDEVEREADREGEREGLDACPYCGEPAEELGECHVCSEAGCLPRDSWAPGDADPCLTACARCARTLHVGCAAEDEAGNPRCPTCSF
jgi:hypothetical protein